MALGDPYIEPLELADFLKMSVTSNDEFLEHATKAASQWVNGYCGQEFNLADTASTRVFDSTDGEMLLVDPIGNATFTVSTDTAQNGTYSTTWAGTDVQALPISALSYGKPFEHLLAIGNYRFLEVTRRQGLARVSARWGWPAVPDAVIQATLIQAARIYKRRESAEGVLGGGDFGVIRVGSRVDPDVDDLLIDFRRFVIA